MLIISEVTEQSCVNVVMAQATQSWFLNEYENLVSIKDTENKLVRNEHRPVDAAKANCSVNHVPAG